MNLKYILIPFLIISNHLFSQENKNTSTKDTIKHKKLDEVVISATRSSSPLNQIPTETSVVSEDDLNNMPKDVSADEALRYVPGVRFDKEDDDCRLHIEMRGEGILSERGIRGIKILIDGIPSNDPSGFVDDLYDIDWTTVKSIEVMHGPEASVYGCSSSAGIINITTMDGGSKPINVTLFGTYGSDALWKSLIQVDGTKDNVNYRITYSHMMGDGYRQHSAFESDNFSEKINWKPSEKLKITQFLTATRYFNQTAESITLQEMLENPKLPNPDAIPFNEYQLTQKFTNAFIGRYEINKNQNIQFNGFIRLTNYTQADDISIDYRFMITTGFSAQYNLTTSLSDLMNLKNLTNHLSVGTDFETQSLTEHQFKASSSDGVDDDDKKLTATTQSQDNDDDNSKYSQAYNASDTILANQLIHQNSIGVFLIDKLDIYKRLYATLNLRYDDLNNNLTDLLNSHLNDDGVFVNENLSGSRNFNKTTAHFGLAYQLSKSLNIYSDWGTGFIPPTTEELVNNPVGFGGFNPTIMPSAIQGDEIGIRGYLSKHLYFDIDGFNMNTKNDFFRYLLTSVRGNQNAFYGNIASSKRYGIESSVNFSIFNFQFSIAYTYSHFRYTSPDSLKNHWIPNCPKHMLNAEISYKFIKHLSAGLSSQYQSMWYIFTDVKDYNITQSGYTIFNFRLSYDWKLSFARGVLSFNITNFINKLYASLTEPDPQLYSYNPAPGRQYFTSLKIIF